MRLLRVISRGAIVASLCGVATLAFAQVDRPFVPDQDNAPPTDEVRVFKYAGLQSAIKGEMTGRLLEGNELFSLNLLHRTGEPPTIHGSVVDLYVILEGSAVLEHGGTVPDAKLRESGRPGDKRGTVMEGTTKTALGKGDVIFIPPGVPHRFVPGETDVWYLNTHFPGR